MKICYKYQSVYLSTNVHLTKLRYKSNNQLYWLSDILVLNIIKKKVLSFEVFFNEIQVFFKSSGLKSLER